MSERLQRNVTLQQRRDLRDFHFLEEQELRVGRESHLRVDLLLQSVFVFFVYIYFIQMMMMHDFECI